MKVFANLKKALVIMSLFAFFTSGILAVNYYMNDDGHGMLPGCPYMDGDSSMCPINLMDHLSVWKQTFTADFSGNVKIVTTLLFVLFLPAVLLEVFIRYFPSIKNLHHFKHENLHFKLFDWVLLALRRGILEPKIYSQARF